VGRIGVVLSALHPLDFLFPQDGADAMNVSRHHRQCDVAFESNDALIRTAIKAMHYPGKPYKSFYSVALEGI